MAYILFYIFYLSEKKKCIELSSRYFYEKKIAIYNKSTACVNEHVFRRLYCFHWSIINTRGCVILIQHIYIFVSHTYAYEKFIRRAYRTEVT